MSDQRVSDESRDARSREGSDSGGMTSVTDEAVVEFVMPTRANPARTRL